MTVDAEKHQPAITYNRASGGNEFLDQSQKLVFKRQDTLPPHIFDLLNRRFDFNPTRRAEYRCQIQSRFTIGAFELDSAFKVLDGTVPFVKSMSSIPIASASLIRQPRRKIVSTNNRSRLLVAVSNKFRNINRFQVAFSSDFSS